MYDILSGAGSRHCPWFLAVGCLVRVVSPRRRRVVESSILIDAESGKVLRAENATYPWYPASTTKLMTLYMTLSAIRDHRITFDTLFTVSPNASSQSPTKMGFPIGTQVTVDNAIKMMMVKSANDMAVMLAEGIGGSIDDFAQEMTETAHRLGMTESNFVNPNGLPADGQIMSARDLAILARALIRDFPEYSFYWHIPAIKFGRRVVRNYNPLLGRYPGTDGMKTGFICASGFNLVATATRDNKQLIAVVLGAPSSGGARDQGGGTAGKRLQSESAVVADAVARHRRRAHADRRDAAQPERRNVRAASQAARPPKKTIRTPATTIGMPPATAAKPSAILGSADRRCARRPRRNLLLDAGPVMPIVVYTGPTRTRRRSQLAASARAADPGQEEGQAQSRRPRSAAEAEAGKRRRPKPAAPAQARRRQNLTAATTANRARRIGHRFVRVAGGKSAARTQSRRSAAAGKNRPSRSRRQSAERNNRARFFRHPPHCRAKTAAA